ncbi:conserved hypothetical protein [Ricinus communis]|uniref:Uncharacterized protein n=1 Tax=Ricinus communis TaxID=3988 RepID=B9SFH9_RICCO|nr:conserved hypothetical protein [Ricinus communis]
MHIANMLKLVEEGLFALQPRNRTCTLLYRMQITQNSQALSLSPSRPGGHSCYDTLPCWRWRHSVAYNPVKVGPPLSFPIPVWALIAYILSLPADPARSQLETNVEIRATVAELPELIKGQNHSRFNL